MTAIPTRVPSRPDEPIAVAHGVPIAYEVLGIQIHLEELVPADEARLDAAMAEVSDWIGDRLRWSLVSVGAEVDAFDPEVFEYATTYPRRLSLPADLGVPPEGAVDAIGLLAEPARAYGVACGDTAPGDHEHAQRTTFRFYADVTRIFPEKPNLSAYSVLRVTVPSDTPTDELERRARALVDKLPVRWAAAGLMLSGAEDKHWKTWKQVSAAYCTRHWGVDVGEYVAWTDEFYDWIRTVNWLTFLGPTMRRDLERAGVALHVEGDVELVTSGDVAMLKAGRAPQRGDVNRLIVPGAYAAVDRLVRPRRHSGDDISFHEKWSPLTTREWIRRFERRTPH